MQSLKKIHAWAQMQVPLSKLNWQLYIFIVILISNIVCNVDESKRMKSLNGNYYSNQNDIPGGHFMTGLYNLNNI